MQTAPESDIKELLHEVLARLSLLEAKGSEVNDKLEALSGMVRINIPQTSAFESETKVVSIASTDSGSNKPANLTHADGGGQMDTREYVCRPPFLRPIPQLEDEPHKISDRKPRLDVQRRANRPQAIPGLRSSGSTLDRDTMSAIRSLLELLSMNDDEGFQDTPEKTRFPIQRTGKIVHKRPSVANWEPKPPALEFDAPTAKTGKQRPHLIAAAAILLLTLLFGGGIIAGMKLSSRVAPESMDSVAAAENTPFAFTDSKNVMEEFLTAASLEEAAQHVYNPDGQILGRMREFYSRPKYKGWQGQLIDEKPVKSILSGSNTFHCWRVRSRDGNVHIAPLYRSNGKIRLYWEAFVGYGGMDWETFVNERPDTPVEMRVVLGKAKNVIVLSDDALVLEVSHPDSDISELVRVTDGITRLLIDSSLQNSQKPIRALVKIAYDVDKSGDKSPVITSFICTGWGEDKLEATDSPAVTARK